MIPRRIFFYCIADKSSARSIAQWDFIPLSAGAIAPTDSNSFYKIERRFLEIVGPSDFCKHIDKERRVIQNIPIELGCTVVPGKYMVIIMKSFTAYN